MSHSDEQHRLRQQQQQHPQVRRGSSDFSIERILAKDREGPAAPLDETERALLLLTGRAGCGGGGGGAADRSSTGWIGSFNRLRSDDSKIPAVAARAAITDFYNQPTPRAQQVKSNEESDNHTDNTKQYSSEELSWLRCTRYCPPKLPRKSASSRHMKRKPGSHPRIPFTRSQIDTLEKKYKTNAYLSRKDVVLLSDLLHLPHSRIKIWFQNRRARERRESQTLCQTQSKS